MVRDSVIRDGLVDRAGRPHGKGLKGTRANEQPLSAVQQAALPPPSFDVQSLASTGLCRKIDGSSQGIACSTEMDVLIAEVIADAMPNSQPQSRRTGGALWPFPRKTLTHAAGTLARRGRGRYCRTEDDPCGVYGA
jgi:hypothetical protein